MDISDFETLPLMGIVRGIRKDDTVPLMESVIQAGLETIEVTMNTPQAADIIKAARGAAKGRIAVGAGTVLGLDDLKTALDAGAAFIVMPVAVDEVIDANVTNPLDRMLELTNGVGPDVVFECAGSVPTSQQSLLMVRRGGTIVVEAICFPPGEVPFNNIVLKGITIKGSQCFSPGEYATALKLIEERKIDVAPLATHRVPLDEINKAFEIALAGEGGKILVKP